MVLPHTSCPSIASMAVFPGLSNIALDGPAAHLLPLHRLNGCVRLSSACKCDEGKSSARVVGISHCAVLSKRLIEVISGGFLRHIVNKQLGSFNLLPATTSSTSSTTTSSTAASSSWCS